MNKTSWSALKIQLLLQRALFTSLFLFSLINMATLRDVWPGIPIVPREYVDICFTVSSGICSGILVYFFADLLPRWMVRRKLEREVMEIISDFVYRSIRRIEQCGVMLETPNGNLRSEEEVKKDFETVMYGDQNDGRDSIGLRLLKIDKDREKFRMRMMPYDYGMMGKSVRKWFRDLTCEEERLFQDDLIYLKYDLETIADEEVGIGLSILKFYEKLKYTKAQLDRHLSISTSHSPE